MDAKSPGRTMGAKSLGRTMGAKKPREDDGCKKPREDHGCKKPREDHGGVTTIVYSNVITRYTGFLYQFDADRCMYIRYNK